MRQSIAVAAATLHATAAAAAGPDLAEMPYAEVRQLGIDNLDVGSEAEALRFLMEAVSRPEAGGDLELLFLTAHVLRDACLFDELLAQSSRVTNAAKLAARDDLAADSEAMEHEVRASFRPVTLQVEPRIEAWSDLVGERPVLQITAERPPTNPAHGACTERLAARWNARLEGIARGHGAPDDVPPEAWRLDGYLAITDYALSWQGCRALEGGNDRCATARLVVSGEGPAEARLPLGSTTPDEPAGSGGPTWPWIVGGLVALGAASAGMACFYFDACGFDEAPPATDTFYFRPAGSAP